MWASCQRAIARYWLQAVAVLAIGAVFAVAVGSDTVERRATLLDFSHEHAMLALMVGADVEHRLAELDERIGGRRDSMSDASIKELLRGARRLEDAGELMVLVARPHVEAFVTADGRLLVSKHLRAALDGGHRTVTIPADEAPSFGLPRRMAIGGLSVVERPEGAWGIVVLGSARRIRNRQRHETWRLGLTILVTTVLVASFGALARRRQHAREREAMLARSDKLATIAALSTGIAHELGTPLGVIVGRVEQVLAQTAPDDRARRPLEIVLEQVGRIQAIARGCLAFARGQSPQLQRAAPRALATNAVALVDHRFTSAGRALDVWIADDLPQVACDPLLVEQALVNVLLNACEASPPGGHVRLRVETHDGSVRFIVDDDGHGISPEIARQATEPFFSTRRAEGGTGLGLTIAREIVAHHGGTLALEPRTPRGTRVTIQLSAA